MAYLAHQFRSCIVIRVILYMCLVVITINYASVVKQVHMASLLFCVVDFFVLTYILILSHPFVHPSGSLHKYDSKVAFWNFCAAGNYAGRFYRFAIRDIQALQASLMTTAMAAIRSTETKLVGSTDLKVIRESLTAVSMDHAAKVVTAWRDLLPQLITK